MQLEGTVSHGLAFTDESPRQELLQGALCFDAGGARTYFSADDICCEADLHGLIVFLFACYSAGTPKYDDFMHHDKATRRIARRPFVSRLVKRMLSNPRGGALAVIGHIDRAWETSISWPPHLMMSPQHFSSCVMALLDGWPIGHAMEYVNQRYAELAIDLRNHHEAMALSDHLGESPIRGFHGTSNEKFETNLTRAVTDARNFVIIGDPAIRIGSN